MLDENVFPMTRKRTSDVFPVMKTLADNLVSALESNDESHLLCYAGLEEDSVFNGIWNSSERQLKKLITILGDNASYFPFRMTVMWFGACCKGEDIKALFLRELQRLHRTHKISNYREILASWEATSSCPESDAGTIVCFKIGDANSRDGKEIERRYSRLLNQPLRANGIRTLDVTAIRHQLSGKYPWAQEAVDMISGELALVARTNGNLSLPNILIHGRPGNGKSQLMMDLCSILKLPYTLLPLAGTPDSGGLGAVARGWATSRASAPVQSMLENECLNPVLILDEIDKTTHESEQKNGNAIGVLLSMISSAQSYYDSCLMSNVNISFVSYLATANSIENLSEPLLDRFQVIKMPNPTSEHFTSIFAHIQQMEANRMNIEVRDLPDIEKDEYRILADLLDYPDCSIRTVRRAYRLMIARKALNQNLNVI